MKRVQTFALLGLLLGGCAVGPDYVRPEITQPKWQHAAELEARSENLPAPALDAWWLGFNDPELSRIITQVRAKNLDLQAALERVLQARALAQGATAKRLPSGEASLQALAERQSLESPLGALAAYSLPDFQRNAQVYDAGSAASWEADLFGQLRQGETAAQADHAVADAMQAGVRVALSADAADAYFQLCAAQAHWRNTEQRLALQERQFDFVRARLSQGAATQHDITQAEAMLAEMRGERPLVRRDIEMQANRLDVLMGESPGHYLSQEKALDRATNRPEVQIPKISLQAAEAADLLRRRPDVRAAERRLAASHARLGVAMAEYYPKLSLSGVLGFESLSSGDLFGRDTFQPLAALGLRWRIFDFGRIDAEVEQANAQTREALFHFRQSVLRAAEDIENASVSLLQQEARRAELERQYAALTRSHEWAKAAYQAGSLASVDLLTSERALRVAEDALQHTQAEAARAAVALFRAMGGG